LAASAFLANWAREIVKDVEDLEADKGNKTTLPMLVKMSSIDAFIGLLLVVAIAVVYVPVALAIFGNTFFLVLVTIANILFILAFREFRSFHTNQSQRVFKAAMGIALFGFLTGVL
jgi:geranylgeranylglycerol-phosphate geranylgeranyltransferase